MIEFENNEEGFVKLWLLVEDTRELFRSQCKRFCIRRVLKSWFEEEADDVFIWEVCHLCEQDGMTEIPEPKGRPWECRMFLKAVTAVRLGVSFYTEVNLDALDSAYNIVYPNSKPLNRNKRFLKKKKK